MNETLSVHSHIYSHSSENRGWHCVCACMREPNTWRLHGPTAHQPQQLQLFPSTCIFRHHLYSHTGISGMTSIHSKKFCLPESIVHPHVLKWKTKMRTTVGKVNMILFIYQKSQNVEINWCGCGCRSALPKGAQSVPCTSPVHVSSLHIHSLKLHSHRGG